MYSPPKNSTVNPSLWNIYQFLLICLPMHVSCHSSHSPCYLVFLSCIQNRLFPVSKQWSFWWRCFQEWIKWVAFVWPETLNTVDNYLWNALTNTITSDIVQFWSTASPLVHWCIKLSEQSIRYWRLSYWTSAHCSQGVGIDLLHPNPWLVKMISIGNWRSLSRNLSFLVL